MALLEDLTQSQLPAIPSENAEPVEPIERAPSDERGRSPDEVVQAREARLPASEVEEPSAPAVPEEKLYEIRGIKYTAKQLFEHPDLLGDLAITHGKYSHLQEKHGEVLKQLQESQAQQPQQVQQPQITNEMVAQSYDQIAKTITDDLVAKGLIEADLPEAYPRAVQTLIGQLRFAFEMIFPIKEKLDRLVADIGTGKAKIQGQMVRNAFNEQLDALVTKDAKLYGGLKDPNLRAAFTEFLTKEVDATIEQTTGEKAQGFLARQWIAFNADSMLDAVKGAVQEKKKQANKRFVMGEGSGSRSGMVNAGELSVMERLIESSGKIVQ